MVRRTAGRTLLVLGVLLLLWSLWSVLDLFLIYRDSVAKGDYAGYGLSLTFYAVLLWPSTVVALFGGFMLHPLHRLDSVRIRRFLGVLFLSGAGVALLAFLRISFLSLDGLLYIRSIEDVAFGLVLFVVSTLPLLAAGALLSLVGLRLVERDWPYSSLS